MAVKAPYGPTSVFNRTTTFASGPESPWPKAAMNHPKSNAMHGNMYVDPSLFYAMISDLTRYSPTRPSTHLSAAPLSDETATTPLDITAPSPSTSEASTVFTDIDGEEPRSAQPDEEEVGAIQVDRSLRHSVKNPLLSLKVRHGHFLYNILDWADPLLDRHY